MESPLLTTKINELRWVFRVESLIFLACSLWLLISPNNFIHIFINSSATNTQINSMLRYFAIFLFLLSTNFFFSAQSCNDPGIKRIGLFNIISNFVLIIFFFKILNVILFGLPAVLIIYFEISARVKLKN